jgi:16S rRNA A1518/A1519 N6-dimethyltransferase RsmA/KsgA/DIM1 with predicted DNA glycosylase/AP lyase activity
VAARRASRARQLRARSQHFLRTASLAAELVRDAGVGADDVVVDLGAGSGRLTAALAPVARRVVAVEVDPAWARRLAGRWPNVDVVQGDALELELPREPFRVVANIPFDRTTDILRRLLDDPAVGLVRADLVVEWGVAMKRALPWPTTANDVRWNACYRFSLARRLPRSGFDPQPAVDAGVLVVERRDVPLVPLNETTPFSAFVARGFRHGLRAVGVWRNAEPRTLDAHEWAALYLSARGGAAAGRGAGAWAGDARRARARGRAAADTARSSRNPNVPQ